MRRLRSLAQHTLATAKTLHPGGNRLQEPTLVARLASAGGEIVGPERLLAEGTRAVVIGPPGAGKTTLLRAVARTRASAYLRGQGPCPLLVQAGELTSDDIHFALAEAAAKQIGHVRDVDLFKRSIEEAKLLLLVDALDEVPAVRRSDLLLRLNDFARRHPRTPFILASRPAALDVPFEGFTYFHLEPLDLQSIHVAVTSFTDNKETGNKFIAALRATPALEQLATSPILLRLLWYIFEGRGTLPANTTDAYADAADFLLSDWDRQKSIRRSTITLAQTHPILQDLAVSMVRQGHNVISENEFAAIVRATMARLGLTVEPRRVLDELLSSGLLVKHTSDAVSFVHRSFLEFYCARAIAVHPDAVIPFIRDRNSHEIVVMACGLLQDTAPILESAIAQREVILAARCVSQGRTRNERLVEYVASSLLREVGDGFVAHLRSVLAQPAPEKNPVEQSIDLLSLWDASFEPDLPSHIRGRRFETFAASYFGMVFKVIHSDLNTENGEIDLICEITRQEPFWSEYGGEVMIECKNWASTVPLATVGTFAEKVALARGVRLGFVLSANGFTDHALRLIKNHAADPAKPLIVPLSGGDVQRALVQRVDHEIFIKDAIREIKYRRLY